MKTKLLILLVTLTTSVEAIFAEKVQIGDLFYELSSYNSTTRRGKAEITYGTYAMLRTISVPDSVVYNNKIYNVTNIGSSVFKDCDSLSLITFGHYLEKIGDKAFYGCHQLSSITIPNSVTNIGNEAFHNCTGLTSVTLGNNITKIGYQAFQNCSNLTFIEIPNSVTNIGHHAFNGCNFTTMTIPNSVTTIGEAAFLSCANLTTISLGDNITSIEGWTFQGCRKLTTVTIPSSLTSIGSMAFDGCNVTTINYSGDIEDWCKKPWTPNSISRYYKLQLKGILQTNVVIPDSLTDIANNTFLHCGSLKTIIIGNNVTSIGYHAFDDCDQLVSVTIPNSVTSIGSYTFSGCRRLNSITLPDSITNIGEYAFQGCSSITSFVIPNGVKRIANGTFRNCGGLTDITIPIGVTSIGREAFYGCSGLTSMTIPNSVRVFGAEAFYSCSGLESINIPDSVTSIGNNAFYNCINLTSVHISNLAAWCAISFMNSTSNPLCYAHNLYLNDELILNLIIPDSVTRIYDYAFYGCNMTSVAISNSVTRIFRYAFGSCNSLTSITIPNGVEYIGECAFENCNHVMEITLLLEQPPYIANNIVNPIIPIYVPCGTMEAYQATSWAEYNIQYKPTGFDFHVSSENTVKGSVAFIEGSSCHPYSFSANPNEGFYFVKWSDGNTDNPRYLTVTQDTTIVAIFEPFIVSFIDDNDTILSAQTYEYGAMPIPPKDPEKISNAQYSYAFAGWSPQIVAVTSDATYKAIYTATLNKYTITFMSEGSVLSAELWEYGKTPIYRGKIPTKTDDEKYTYTFNGWSPDIVSVVADATYSATFTATEKPEAINAIFDDSTSKPTKFIENGNIYILMPEGKKYSIIGEQLN